MSGKKGDFSRNEAKNILPFSFLLDMYLLKSFSVISRYLPAFIDCKNIADGYKEVKSKQQRPNPSSMLIITSSFNCCFDIGIVGLALFLSYPKLQNNSTKSLCLGLI